MVKAESHADPCRPIHDQNANLKKIKVANGLHFENGGHTGRSSKLDVMSLSFFSQIRPITYFFW